MRRASLILLASLVLASALSAGEVDPEGVAHVELVGPPRAPYEHEPYTLRLRVAYDPAFFEAWGTELFRRPLDLPFQVVLPWDDEDLLPGPSELLPVPPGEGARIALGDDVVTARHAGETWRDGRRLALLEVTRRYASLPPGPIEIPAPVLRFAYATAFEEDFFGGRRAVDRHDVRREGEPLELERQALPTEGRPAGFLDAVGRFEMEASGVETGTAGRHRVSLRIRGEGNLATLTPPRLEDVPAAHVLGRLDAFEDGVRIITWDVEVAPEGGALLPPFTLSYFDPAREAWGIERTAPVPLGDGPPPAASPAARPPSGWLTGALLALALLALVGLATHLARRRPRDDREPVEPERPPVDASQALLEHAAAILDRPAAAAVDVALEARLVERGLDPALAARLAAAVEATVAARYGGRPPAARDLQALLAELGRRAP